jgi:hypothetical protein
MPKIFSFINGIEHKFDDRNLSEAKDDAIQINSQIAFGLIREHGLDQTTQQNAALGIYPPERCEAIKSYIAACRNEYLRCKALILAATTNDEADAVTFTAPPVPEGL